MSPKRILVVDDEPDVCRYLAILFEGSGYAVSCACDAYEAAHRVKQARPDLIMLDLSLPHKSGLKFYREMKSTLELSRIPIVVIAMPAGPRANLRDADGLGAARHQLPPPDGIIVKPIQPDEMIRLVSGIMSKRDTVSSG
jgi:CheY-like chemotaxis protein